ncbi:MAG: hypothetical protein IPP90_04180 [Gemmatimonadaceae bacterium]|nr:hypothetical protein [Gemmatimonadaceae bacterium]
MTTRLLVAFALVGFLSAPGSAQAPDPTKMVGHWTGTGTFFDADLLKRVGPLAIELTMRPDGTGSGQLGGAAIRVLHSRPTRDVLQVRADLAGSPAQDAALRKPYLFFVITAASDSTLQGEFHLKSNRFYDPWMREGRLRLTRVP